MMEQAEDIIGLAVAVVLVLQAVLLMAEMD